MIPQISTNAFLNRSESFVKSYKLDYSHPSKAAQSVDVAVREIMDELLEGIW